MQLFILEREMNKTSGKDRKRTIIINIERFQLKENLARSKGWSNRKKGEERGH